MIQFMANKNRTIKNPQPPKGMYQEERVSYQENKMTLDQETGEIIEYHQVKGFRQKKEPNYIKLYIDTMMSFQGIDKVPTDFIIVMSKYINGYNNDENTPLYFTNNKFTKMQMAKDLNLGIDMINKYIKKLKDAGVLIKTKDMRGVYTCNPWIIARGSWQNSICGLRTHFDFINGEWTCDIEFKEDALKQHGDSNNGDDE